MYDTLYYMAHARKRIRKLSTAVFRGSKSEYSFDVFPISTSITDNPAIFIFSRRQIDKFGRGHHVVSCVGETQSIIAEIKKHKRARCVKGNEANVVCILKEADRDIRSGVTEDIVAARTFCCVRGTIKTNIKAKSNAKKPGSSDSAKILAFKPQKPAAKTRAGNVRIVAPPAKPSPGKRRNAKPAVSAKRASKPQPKPTTNKKTKPAADRKRVQGSMDSDSGQRRLSKPKRAIGERTKARVASNSRSRKRRAA
jgi:hypothetical protein